MAVKNLSDEMWAGNLRVQRFTVTDEDIDGSPAKNLTGFTVKWALARIDDAGTYLTTPVLEKTAVLTDAANGICEVTLAPADTTSLFGTFYFELEATDGSSNPVVVGTGRLVINRNVVNS